MGLEGKKGEEKREKRKGKEARDEARKTGVYFNSFIAVYESKNYPVQSTYFICESKQKC